MEKANLRVGEVAKLVGVHVNTIINYERRGVIKSMRDINNYRRYTMKDALELKRIISSRKPSHIALVKD